MLVFLGASALAHAQERFKPGDQISISVWQDPKLDRTVLVDSSGMISFPLAGHVRAGGLTAASLENILRGRLQKNYSDRLDITVALATEGKLDDDNKPKVYITGEIARPGPYFIVKRTSVMQALALAGGLSPFAAKQRIQVRRKINGVEAIHNFDYEAFEAGIDTSGNIDLRPDDVIIVPERGLFN
jgi:polysaccharide export outer membrane protein